MRGEEEDEKDSKPSPVMAAKLAEGSSFVCDEPGLGGWLLMGVVGLERLRITFLYFLGMRCSGILLEGSACDCKKVGCPKMLVGS